MGEHYEDPETQNEKQGRDQSCLHSQYTCDIIIFLQLILMAFEMANECGMVIRKALLGTMRILNDLNANVTDGIALERHSFSPNCTFSPNFKQFLPLSCCVGCCVLLLCCKIWLLWPQDQVDGLHYFKNKKEVREERAGRSSTHKGLLCTYCVLTLKVLSHNVK